MTLVFVLLSISVLCLWLVVLIHIHIVHGAVDSNGNIITEKKELKLDCLLYSDGTLAVVQYSGRGGCGVESGALNTISYLLKKGYHIDDVVPAAETGDFMIDLGSVFMSR